MSDEDSMSMTPDADRKPSWRARQYGKHRSRDQNFRAWFFADAFGRSVLRDLRYVRRVQRQRERRGR